MVSGAIWSYNNDTKYKIGSGFTFLAKPYQMGLAWQSALYSGELGMWLGTSWANGHPFYPAPPGGTVIVYNSSSYTAKEGNGTITFANFCAVSLQSNGKGSLTASGTAYGEYRQQNTSVTFTASPSDGYRLKKMLVNGSEVQTSGNSYTITIQYDVSVVAYFVPTQYTVTCNEPTGGVVEFTKITSEGESTTETAPFYANIDDVIICTATPDSDKMVQIFVLDGTVCSGGSTGPQNFTFTIFERADDSVYNCQVSFSDRTSVAGYVSGKSDDVEEDATLTCGDEEVERTEGVFQSFIGNIYVATAAEPTIFRTFIGWMSANGEILSENYKYTWTQGSSSVSITATYEDKTLYTENFYIGTSTRDSGTGSTAYIAGCRATIVHPSGTCKNGKWLEGTRTVTATSTPSGWSFSGVYVSDTDKSGGTKFYKANGASSVTFYNACNAYIYAIFANGSSVLPIDVDQGNSTIAAGSLANGMYRWEGGNASLTMRWHSKRFIASQPMTLSTARVYAEEYSTGGTNDVKLKTLTFQSPESTDAKAVDTTAKSQDAYRIPMRRPEKYIEIIVSAPHEVTQAAVATSMEALWQT